MATEHDVILRVGLDTRDADEKAAKTAKNLSGMAGGGAGGALSSGSFRIGAGLATGGVAVAASALAAAGADKAGAALQAVAGDMAKFGTMLAPLGPVAAGAGVAIGALTGGIKAFAEDARKTRERLESEFGTSVKSRSSAYIAHLDLEERAKDDPRGALSALRSARRNVRDMSIRSAIGENLTQQEVEYMAAWDPDAARKELQKRTKGKAFDANDWQFILLDALNLDALKDARSKERYVVRQAGWDERIGRATGRYREIATGKWRNGPDEADLERRIAEEESADGNEGPKAAARSLFAAPARADAMQAAGMGVVGAGYDRQEKYLERIVAILGGVERNTGRPARPAPAVAG